LIFPLVLNLEKKSQVWRVFSSCSALWHSNYVFHV